MKKIILISAFCSSLSLLGCATLSQEQCESADWGKIGVIDGNDGKPADYYKQHERACHKTQGRVDPQLYLVGWEEGHKKFCTAEGGYKAGLSGQNLYTLCPEDKYPEFAEQYKIGHGVNLLLGQKSEVDKQIERENEDHSTLANINRGLLLWSGASPTEKLDEKKAAIDEKIAAIDSNAPGGPQVESRQDISQYFSRNPGFLVDSFGAFAGTIYGFGIGHAIQGRYSTSGWKWTVGEVATLGALVVTSNAACGENSSTVRSNQEGVTTVQKQCGSGAMALALVTWLGFRIWQSYDLISYVGAEHNRYTASSSMIVAKPDGLLWVYGF